MVPFNKPFLSGKELDYIKESVLSGKISGDGIFTKKVHNFFEQQYSFRKCLLTTSCTDALEMAAILIDLKEGDEVIMPSYTFVSTANAFVLRGATIVFADSRPDHPGIDEAQIESLVTPKTKAIVVVHYAGVACDMDVVMDVANRYGLFVIEDAAQAIDSYYTNKNGVRQPLGSIGHLSAFSFHETKNIISGEGGLLVINDERFIHRAEIIREKGTNRSAFFRGEIDKYGWVDIGSSFLPSDIVAAFLYAQLENLEHIQARRRKLWDLYQAGLKCGDSSGNYKCPNIPDFACNNGHMFYLVFDSLATRTAVLQKLRADGFHSVFHYISLHKSEFFKDQYTGGELKYSDHYTDCLLRLPLFYELTEEQVQGVCASITSYFDKSNN